MSTALITGAGRGLGRALADVFAAEGYGLILNCRDSNIPKPNDVPCKIVKGDIRNWKTIRNLQNAAFICGDLKVLINNVGMHSNRTFPETPFESIKEIIETNLIAPMGLTRILWEALKQNKGLVININSIAGKEASDASVAYCASKFGLRGFSEALQFDGTRDGVRVVSVYLGAMNTDMSNGRGKDAKQLINPHDAAEYILDACCKERATMRVTEINLLRRWY